MPAYAATSPPVCHAAPRRLSALRHSDYTVDFDIRQFTDIEEIKRLVETAPQKLSLNEFYLAAQTYTPGSEPYNRLFDTAVRMYPDSEVANLNAANAAMSRRDLTSAASFLAKAGDSPEATYARGILAATPGPQRRRPRPLPIRPHA